MNPLTGETSSATPNLIGPGRFAAPAVAEGGGRGEPPERQAALAKNILALHVVCTDAGTHAQLHCVPPASAEGDVRHGEVRMEINEGGAPRAPRTADPVFAKKPLRRDRTGSVACDREIAEALFALLRDLRDPENVAALERGYFGGRGGNESTEGDS